MTNLAQFRKAFVGVVGGLAEAVSLGVLHGTAENVALIVIAGATAAGVYTVPNKPKAG